MFPNTKSFRVGLDQCHYSWHISDSGQPLAPRLPKLTSPGIGLYSPRDLNILLGLLSHPPSFIIPKSTCIETAQHVLSSPPLRELRLKIMDESKLDFGDKVDDVLVYLGITLQYLTFKDTSDTEIDLITFLLNKPRCRNLESLAVRQSIRQFANHLMAPVTTTTTTPPSAPSMTTLDVPTVTQDQGQQEQEQDAAVTTSISSVPFINTLSWTRPLAQLHIGYVANVQIVRNDLSRILRFLPELVKFTLDHPPENLDIFKGIGRIRIQDANKELLIQEHQQQQGNSNGDGVTADLGSLGISETGGRDEEEEEEGEGDGIEQQFVLRRPMLEDLNITWFPKSLATVDDARTCLYQRFPPSTRLVIDCWDFTF